MRTESTEDGQKTSVRITPTTSRQQGSGAEEGATYGSGVARLRVGGRRGAMLCGQASGLVQVERGGCEAMTGGVAAAAGGARR